ncbi:plasmid replication protein, CyRepA1 family [Nodularia spumigena]|uniref:plasmid replication protein, CyRepA1 family n=1 Tax=Nodularia spumigena TaxID=70799 RepID=UPI002B1F25B0|nr:plasmid replication protein, CyRepA1 family [Nodularia spumigena]MEA5559310.1 plasmid replication protein, CyRepA1 family [Nodularia spumigena CH309]
MRPGYAKEWLASGIDTGITSLNVIHLEGEESHEYLLSDAIAKLGEGKKVPHSSQFVTAEVAKLTKRYSHALSGGWWCSGLDPLNDWGAMEWGCFKPNKPRRDFKKGKIIKYEHPPNVATRAFFLKVPNHIWDKVASRYGVPTAGYSNFWDWVVKENIPVVFCEGAKKAGALLTCGVAAVALPGIFGAYRKDKDNAKKHHLIPEIEVLATPKREITICFDNDDKPTTKLNVIKAISGTARLLKSRRCRTKVAASWNYPEKGIDDVLVVRGSQAVEEILINSLLVPQWEVQRFYKLSRKVNLNLSQKFLGDIFKDIAQKIIGVKSPKGTGKTESLKPLIEQLSKQGYSCYLISHRIQLAQALASRLNIPYIDDVGRHDRDKGFSIVIDSLHGEGKGQFDVENDVHLLTNKYVVIIDEIEQVLWHLLNSSTEVKKHRAEVIKQLQLLLLNADKIICLDADLTDVSLDFIKDAAQCNDDDFFIISNDYTEGGYQIFNYEENTAVNWLRDLLAAIEKGENILICCDSQKLKSKFSTQNIEAKILQSFPYLKNDILRIDSEAIADPNHPAYGCISRINNIVSSFKVVLMSPSVGTGISIDVRDHFAGVWGCFNGVQPENSVRQQLKRLRDNVPRHLWINNSGLGRIGDGSTSLFSILNCNKKQFKIHVDVLRKIEVDISEDRINGNDSALNAYAKISCRINSEMQDYRNIILKNLAGEGNTIAHKCDYIDESFKEEITKFRDDNYQREREEVAATDISDMNDDGYQLLCNKKAKTKLDRYRERKYSLASRYGIESITPDLILKDDDGYYPQIRLHYYLMMAEHEATERDKKAAENIREKGAAFLPDFNRGQWLAKIKLLQKLNIPEILQLDKITQCHDLIMDMDAKVKSNSWDVGLFLGKYHPDMKPIQVLRKILKFLGLGIERIGREGGGDRNWIYEVTGLDDGRGDIFQRWLNPSQSDEKCINVIPNPAKNPYIDNKNNLDVDDQPNTQIVDEQINQPNIDEQENQPNTPKNCFVWDGRDWVGAILHKLETLPSGIIKAHTTLFNGLEFWVWDANLISLC